MYSNCWVCGFCSRHPYPIFPYLISPYSSPLVFRCPYSYLVSLPSSLSLYRLYFSVPIPISPPSILPLSPIRQTETSVTYYVCIPPLFHADSKSGDIAPAVAGQLLLQQLVKESRLPSLRTSHQHHLHLVVRNTLWRRHVATNMAGKSF